MPTAPAAIPLIPTPVPSTSDPSNFDVRADATLTALPDAVDGMNAAGITTYDNAVEAEASATDAAAAQVAAEAAAATAVNAPGTKATVAGNINIPGMPSDIAFNLDQMNKAFALGQLVRTVKQSDITKFFEGRIKAFVPATGAITVAATSASAAALVAGPWEVALAIGGTITTAAITDYIADQAARAAVLQAEIDALDVRIDPMEVGLEQSQTQAIAAGVVAINLALLKTDWEVPLTAAITAINITNPPAAGPLRFFTLRLQFNGTTYAVAWPATFKWAGGSAPSFSFTNGKEALIQVYTDDAGTKYHAFFIGESG